MCPRGSHVPAASCCALGPAGWEKETAAQPGQRAGATDQLCAAKLIASSTDVVLSSAHTPPASPAARNNPPRRKPEEEGTMPSPPAEASVRPPPGPLLCFEPALR